VKIRGDCLMPIAKNRREGQKMLPEHVKGNASKLRQQG
jgi:hypothetical protein